MENTYIKEKKDLEIIISNLYYFDFDVFKDKLIYFIKALIFEEIEFEDELYIYFKKINNPKIINYEYLNFIGKYEKINKLIIWGVCEEIKANKLKKYHGRCKKLYKCLKISYEIFKNFYKKYYAPIKIYEIKYERSNKKWIEITMND